MAEFSRSFRGYDRAEVDAALARHASDLARLQHQVESESAKTSAMQVEIRELHERMTQYRQREASLAQDLEEIRRRRDEIEREARAHAQQMVLEAQERATLLKSEGLRQVGELQAQVEQLLGMRAGLTQAFQRLSEDVAAAMARLAAAPATSIDRPVEDHIERWSSSSDR